MRTLRTDVAILGAGTAGLVARREAERCGADWLLVEGGPLGTTCARVGCMPSKLLIAAADAAHRARSAHRFGVRIDGSVSVDGRAVLERVRRERDRFVAHVVEDVQALPADRVLRGWARFLGPRTLAVGDDTRVEARAVVIATGSTPVVPEGLRSVGPLTSDSLFELEALPRSVAVVGSGPAGLELGQALHRLGVATTIYGHSERLGSPGDPTVQRAARSILGAELELRLGVTARAERAPDGRIRVHADGEQDALVDALLVAAGRRPNVDALDPAAAGLAPDGDGRPHADPHTGQWGDAPVFLAGDVSGDRGVLHEAADEGRIAGRNAARFPDVRASERRIRLAIVFCDPQLAVVGAGCVGGGEGVVVGGVDYTDQGRARVLGRNAGCVRIAARRADGRLVGAEMFGPGVEHMAHLVAAWVQSELTVDRALALPFYHPVLEEGLRTALRDLARQLGRAASFPPRDLDCGPGA